MFRSFWKKRVPEIPNPELGATPKEEIEKTKRAGFLARVAYSESGGKLRESIESNGIFEYLVYKPEGESHK